MPTITVIADPACLTARDVHQVEDGTRLADWIIGQYGPDGFGVPTVIYEGAIIKGTELDLNDYERMNRPIVGPVWLIHSPLGAEVAIAIAVGLVVAVAVALLMPIPELGSSGPAPKKSPNNALSGQTNVARTLDRVPDIFGKVRSFPDLIAPTVSEFVDHIKFQIEYLCIGRGFYLLEDFKTGDTLISDVAGTRLTVYEPGEAPVEVLKTRQSNEVSGQTLVPPNEAAEVLLAGADITYDSGTDTATITAGAGTWDAFGEDNLVNIKELWANTGGVDYLLSGAYTIAAPTATDLILTDATAENANWAFFDAVVTQPLANVGGQPLTPTATVTDLEPERGPFVVPGDNNGEVWLDVTAPTGLARGEELNKTLSIDLLFLFEEIDADNVPTGVNFNYNVTVTDNVRDPRFWTFKVTPADGLIDGNRYQVTGSRVTPSDPANNLQRLENIRWARLAGIENVAGPDTTGTTRVVIETQATQQVAAIQERQFNVNATRRVVRWNGSRVVGNITTGEGLVASRRMADIFLHYMLDPGLAARTEASLDIVGLYEVQRKLDRFFDGKKGEFSFTFDDQSTPALEELRRIAQAARGFVYREGSVYSVTRDEEQPIAQGLFNRRNKVPDSESKSVRFNRPLDHDGIQLEYNDIDDDNNRTIRFPEDLPADDPHAGLPPAVNPLKIDGIGIRQYVQAWDRAQYEFRKLIYRRVSVESTVSADGILVPLNARVQHVDGTRIATVEGDADQLGYPILPLDVSDGELTVVGEDGLTMETTGRCVFRAGETYSVILRDERGTPSTPLLCSANPSTEFGFTLHEPAPFTLTVRGDNEYQRGTLYNFGPDGNDQANAYLVQRKTPDANKTVRLELINYTPEYYAADMTEPPEKPPL